MLNIIHSRHIYIFVGAFSLALIFEFLLLKAPKSLRLFSWFGVAARKSNSNAIQLGGIPIAFVTIVSLIVLSFLESQLVQRSDVRIIKYWIISALMIVAYGYFDDKYELRSIVKLSIQLIAVSFFSLLCSVLLFPDYSISSFLILTIVGLTLLNGANLIDGIDTVTVKTSMVTFLGYLYIGLFYGHALMVQISVIATAPILAFYFFNKEPSKIHLGESGGTFIGFTYLLLSVLTFNVARHQQGVFSAYSMSFIPLIWIAGESIVSLSRRIINKNAPFKGDKLHFHHILTIKNKLTSSEAASYIALSFVVILFSSLFLSFFVHSFYAFCFGISSYAFCILSTGYKHWFKSKNSDDVNLNEIFVSLKKENITVFNFSSIDKFEIIPIQRENLNKDEVA